MPTTIDYPAAGAGGPWTAADHDANPSFDPGLARAISALFDPPYGWYGRRAIDWGGGFGFYLDELAEIGALTAVVEPLCRPADPRHMWIDLSMAARPAYLGPRYLTICTEVLEHIPANRHRVALDNVCRTVEPGGWLVFSAATPGQGGCGHVAERPEAEWRGELFARGLVEDPDKTAALRAAATLPWFRANLMAWRRP